MEGSGTGLMIRVFRSWAKQDKQSEYERMVRAQVLSYLRSQPGLMSVHAGARAQDGSNEFVIVSVWKDLDSIKKATGGRWQEPVLLPGEAELLDRSEVEHFEEIEAPGDVM